MKNRVCFPVLLSFWWLFSVEVQSASNEAYIVYPIPQHIVCSDKTLKFSSEINIVAESSITDQIKDRAAEVLKRAGYTYQYASVATDEKTNLYIGENGSGKQADRYLTQYSSLSRSIFEKEAQGFDPYLLQITANKEYGDIAILGDDQGSAFYALASLEQLLEQGDNRSFRETEILDYAYTCHRGIVEGFYGHPWSVENRLDILDYCKRYKLNTYVYGPKADPYHLGSWREEYPLSLTERQRYMGLITQGDLQTIATKARQCNVNFVWAIHPALQNGISFSGKAAMDTGIAAIMKKFEHLYGLGVRGFGVFIDDMTYTPSGEMQAYLADQVQKKIREKYPVSGMPMRDRIAPLFFVPTAYALNYGGSHTLNDLKGVDEEAVILFTGDNTFSHIKNSSVQDMSNRVGRSVVLWWNNPVNDNADDCLFMRGLTSHWKIEAAGAVPNLSGLLLNPMNQAQASKPALFSGADYAWNPVRFDEFLSWEHSFRSMTDEPDLVAALKLFAENSDSKLEDAVLKTYYQTFKAQYTGKKLPLVAGDLSDKMRLINDACAKLIELEDSDRLPLRLLYDDIGCWVRKLESMTRIVIQSIAVMSASETHASWEEYLSIRKEYNKLHTDSLFIVSALEDSGTSTREQFYEVHPSATYMEPFVDYMVGILEDYAPQLPQRSRGVELISNMSELPGVALLQSVERLLITGLQGLELSPGTYIGLFFNQILEIGGDAWRPFINGGICLEYSMNGKDWVYYPDTEEKKVMAYLRLKNSSVSSLRLNIDELEVELPLPGTLTPVRVETNMSPYQSYLINRVVDGDRSTFFWKGAPQKVGDYITLVYDSSSPRYEIRMCFTGKDMPSGTINIELSDNNRDWELLTSFDKKELHGSSNIVACNAGGKPARYIRCIVKSVVGNDWLQLAEIEVDASHVHPVAFDSDNKPISVLDDRSLAEGYKAKGAGFLIFQFIENIAMEEIRIYQSEEFPPVWGSPEVELFIDGGWQPVGYLDKYCTVIDTKGLGTISKMKIHWNDKKIPDIYEILPIGEEYTETSFGSVIRYNDEKVNIRVEHDEGIICISFCEVIRRICLHDVTGRILKEKTSLDHTTVLVVLNEKHPLLFITVEMCDGKQKVYKLMS